MIADNHPEVNVAFQEWMDGMEGGAPTNGDIVRHDKIDVGLLHNLAEFMWHKAKSANVK